MERSQEDGPQETKGGVFIKRMDRRRLLKTAGLAGAALGVGSAFGGLAGATAETAEARRTTAPDVSGDCVAVLGLGAGPALYGDKNNTGFALFHNGSAYLIDSGAGTPKAFAALGVTLDKVKGVFFTHHHVDHTAGYADLLSRGFWQLAGTLSVWGPSLPKVGGVDALKALTDGIMAAFDPGYELDFWVRPYLGIPPSVPAPRPDVAIHPIVSADPAAITVIPILTDDPDMRVEAIEVDHDEDFGTCYAYRFTLLDKGTPTGKVVVFSGDRAHYNARRDFSDSSPYYAEGGQGHGKGPYFPEHPTIAEFQEAFRSFAAGATLLVHEASKKASATLIASPESPDADLKAFYWHLVDSHTDVGEIPVIAKDANVGAVVLSHYGDYTWKRPEVTRRIILSGVLEANAKVGYRGKIIAPMEMDVIRF